MAGLSLYNRCEPVLPIRTFFFSDGSSSTVGSRLKKHLPRAEAQGRQSGFHLQERTAADLPLGNA